MLKSYSLKNMITVVSLILIVLLILNIFGLKSPNKLSVLDVLTGLTLIVLIYYAYDTHRIANQTVESNLRPVILRSGVITWTTVQFTINDKGGITGHPLKFSSFKNIATDITGYIIINNRQHNLLFGNQESLIISTTTTVPSQQGYVPTWGWLPSGSMVQAIFDPRQEPMATTEENKIYIKYKDIQNNQYYTWEDKNYSQTSGKL